MVSNFFVGFLCAMTLFSGLGIRKLIHWLFPICVHSEKVCSWTFHFIQWINRFMCNDFIFWFGHTKINPLTFPLFFFTLKRYAVECFTSSNQWIDFCTTIQTGLLAYEFLRRSKSTLQYKSKHPHAPLRSQTFGSSSIHLFPKSAGLLLQVPAKRDAK